MQVMELQLDGLVDQSLPNKIKTYNLIFNNVFPNQKLSNCFCNYGVVKYQNKPIDGIYAVRKNCNLKVTFTIKALQFIQQHQIRKVSVDVKRKEEK